MINAKEFPTKAMEEVFNLGVWSVPHAAWIFAGYSPLQIREIGHLIRLANDEPIPFGSLEYREAEKDMHRIAELLYQELSGSIGNEFLFEKDEENDGVNVYTKPHDHLDRNWLIDQVVNFIKDSKISVWWVDKLIGHGWLPAYINPDSLSPTMQKERGMNIFAYPHAPTVQVNAFVTAEQVVSGLIEEGKVKPLFGQKSVISKIRFFLFLQDFMKREFMHKGKPLPSALEFSEAVLYWQRSNIASTEWEIITKGSFILDWKELNPPENKEPEKGSMTRNAVATSLNRWFSKY